MKIIEKRGKLARGQGGHEGPLAGQGQCPCGGARGEKLPGRKRKLQNLVAGNTISFNKNKL